MLNHSPGSERDHSIEEFTDCLVRLFNKAAAIEREPVDTGDGVLLFTSEIHLIDMAGRFPEESMTALAARLGITKGAVSQTAKKLEQKGYLVRAGADGDNKTVFLRLTETGWRAYHWHRTYHDAVNARLGEVFIRLPPGERARLLALLSRMEEVFDACPATRQEITTAARRLEIV